MLTFDDFKKRAKDNSLKKHRKVGRGDIHIGEKNLELNIFPDVKEKLHIAKGTIICDIGCGCSAPVLDLIEFCRLNKNRVILIDSKEMLDQLPEGDFIEKWGFEFPKNEEFLNTYRNQIDYIVTYSVVQTVFVHGNMYHFLDQAVSLLKHGGKMLVGDLPNISKKKRFLSSDFGIKFHQEWSGTNEIPKVEWNILQPEEMDESVIFSILQRYRNMGYETYLLPQKDGLPMNKTREDILIVKW